MQVVADLHIHSPFSRATSKDMSFKNLERGALVKGLDVLGTGDFTHPRWREEIRASLVLEDGLYKLKEDGRVRYILSGEVCTTFDYRGRTRRIHHIILLPSMEVAEQLCPILEKRGGLEGDGRPNLSMTGVELVEEVSGLGEECMVIPAHIWTPWFSLFGDRGGVDHIEECYEDQTPHIYALETGLSSDPPMNWRVSELDRFTLVSNSDSHSPSPWRIGREANILEVSRLTYRDIVETIMYRKERVTTIEVDPAYGKYHWTGHRSCNVSVPPAEAIRLKGICPVCGRRMTKGVAERVEELADREEGVIPRGVQRFIKVLPLSEVIATVLGKDVFSAEVQRRYWEIVGKFSNELEVLTKAPEERLVEICGKEIAEVALMNRENRLVISPGYDGVYGRLEVEGAGSGKRSTGGRPAGGGERFLRRTKNLDDYINAGR
jgi:uncharacterized protein (TIGR00375 family)